MVCVIFRYVSSCGYTLIASREFNSSLEDHGNPSSTMLAGYTMLSTVQWHSPSRFIIRVQVLSFTYTRIEFYSSRC